HRDIKPANVLFSGATPRLADFGVARQIDAEGVTQTGEAIGTPGYMSPEQGRGASGQAGPSADVYGLGALLYESLTGVPPFRAPTAVETLRMVVEQDPVPPRRLQPSVPRDLEVICLKCLEKQPERRYPTAKELHDDLQRFLTGRPIIARPGSMLRKFSRWVGRNRTAAGLLVILVISVVSFLVAWGNMTWQLNQTNEQLTEQAVALQETTQQAIENEQEAERNLEAQTAANAALQEVLNFFTSDLFDAATTEQQGVNLTVLEVLEQADAKIRQKTPDRPRVEAPLRLAIGNTLELIGQPQKAVVHLERADELYRDFDPFSATAFDCRQVLARCLATMGNRQRALHLTRELTSSEWTPSNLQQIRLRHDLLRFDSSERSTEENVRLLTELHTDCVQTLGRRDVVTLSILSAIATEWFRAQEFEKALEIFKTELAESEKELGPDHVDTYNAANNVAVTLIRLGRLDEAEAIHRENLRRQMMFRGPRDAGTAGTMHNLAMVVWRQSKRREAVDLLKEVVQGRAAALGPVERRTLESLYQIGRMFVEMEEFVQGYAFLTEHFWNYREAARGTREWVDMFNVFADLAVSAGAYDDANASIEVSRSLLDAMGDGYSSQHNALKAAEAALRRVIPE
ncbi:MAG: tetratricopeptide repeat protein, partial [Planctomycetaceae bacterium]|nr:tetratricopeptide repeat protein [Planctomycetaceae bacterium]